MNRSRYMAVLIATLFLSPVSADKQTPGEKGLKIALEADKRHAGFIDYTASMLMVLKNKHGQESRRIVRTRTLEIKDDGDKGLSIFDNPKDVKGTIFLTHSHKTKDDDQWLYLPALKRAKRITSRNKSGSFMGSEFAYEDISSEEVEKYTYEWIRDEKFNDMECFVFERYPVDKRNSGYTRQTAWLDKEEYRTWKVEYYDRKESLLKTLTARSYKKYIEKFWKPDEFNMVNHQNGKSTTLTWSDYKFRTGLKDRDFSVNSLKRTK
ncbi:outer membrane lipoprotein-sorting protein [Elusimicrobiota bacterium]